MYKHGTCVAAVCPEYELVGFLVGDHDELDGIVKLIADDDGKTYHLNGWLWSFCVIECAELEPAQPEIWPELSIV